jgi:competence protein ComGC
LESSFFSFQNEAAVSPHRHHSPFFSGRWIMFTHLERRGLTLVGLIVVLFVIGLLAALSLPAICASKEAARRNGCLCKLKQLGLALENHESAMRHYPVASWNNAPQFDALASNPAGTSGTHVTGYSWMVAVLPWLEQKGLFGVISINSTHFESATGPFDPAIGYGGGQHASRVTMPALICPSWAGDGYTNSNTTVDIGPSGGAPAGYGAPEYARRRLAVAPTNYKPMVGTHMQNGAPVENGGTLLTRPKGLSHRAFADGTANPLDQHGLTHGDFADGGANTILICETREASYASWYDGTLNWLVGQDPTRQAPGTNDKPPWTNAVIAVNRGFDPSKSGSVPYLKKSLSSNNPQNDVWWGPSSDHAGGIVCHVFADGHTIAITDECDPQIYLSLITRAGGELIDGEPLSH